MPISTQSTGDLVTAAMWNAIVSAVNNLMAHKTDGQTLETWGATAKTIGPSVGDFKQSGRTTDDGTAWLMCNGRTVGNASSGGTARANADMSTLFIFLWTNYTNTELVIQTSAGSPTTRGASALADFDAGKRMPLPDLRGRALVTLDNLGGTSANRITNAQADINGGVMGSETHTLTTTEMPAHTHNSGGGTGYLIAVGSGGSLAAGGGGTIFVGATGGSSGSNGSHNNVQPAFFVNTLIYTGL